MSKTLYDKIWEKIVDQVKVAATTEKKETSPEVKVEKSTKEKK